jgi:hypothetical protein
LINSPDELYPVLEAFKPALKSIDVRIIAVALPNEEWQNLVTVIFLSNKTVEETKVEQESIPSVQNDYFAIFCDALPFNYLIFGKIANGEIRFPLSSFSVHRIKTRAFDPLTLKVSSTQEWINGSSCYILKSADIGIEEDRKKLWEIVLNQNIWAKGFGFSNIHEMIRRYLEIDYNHGNRKDFEIVIYPLAQIPNLQFSANQLIVNVQKPTQLDGLQLNLQLKRDSQIVWQNTGKIESPNNSIVFTINGLLPFDLLTVELIHRDSGLTR